jgi:hypothetical protein
VGLVPESDFSVAASAAASVNASGKVTVSPPPLLPAGAERHLWSANVTVSSPGAHSEIASVVFCCHLQHLAHGSGSDVPAASLNETGKPAYYSSTGLAGRVSGCGTDCEAWQDLRRVATAQLRHEVFDLTCAPQQMRHRKSLANAGPPTS